jgi:prolyl oligopeptidase
MKIYLRRGLHGSDRLVVDPEKVTLAPADRGKGRSVVASIGASKDGKHLAALIVPGGDELHGEIHVFNTATGRETGDVITRAGAEVFQVCWLPDNHSFVYGRPRHLPPGAPASETRQKFRSYLHVLGMDPAKDRPVFGYGVVPSIDVDPSLIASVQTQPGSRYALGVLNGSVTPNSAYYIEPIADLGKTNTAWRKVADFADGVTSIVTHGNDLYVLTYKNAPRYEVVRIDARDPDLTAAETVVAPSQAVITQIHSARDALYVELLDGGINRVLRVPYCPQLQPEEIGLPIKGSAFIDTDPRLPGALLNLTSWTRAFTIYAYDPATRQVTDTSLQPEGPYDRPANIESVEVKARSYDGMLVPLSIVHAKGIKLDGSNPTLLEGYGGYGYSLPPYFDPRQLAWYENGGVYSVCHVWGGGEYGEEWHLAGQGPRKPNTWRDFIACAHACPKKIRGLAASC